MLECFPLRSRCFPVAFECETMRIYASGPPAPFGHPLVGSLLIDAKSLFNRCKIAARSMSKSFPVSFSLLPAAFPLLPRVRLSAETMRIYASGPPVSVWSSTVGSLLIDAKSLFNRCKIAANRFSIVKSRCFSLLLPAAFPLLPCAFMLIYASGSPSAFGPTSRGAANRC